MAEECEKPDCGESSMTNDERWGCDAVDISSITLKILRLNNLI